MGWGLGTVSWAGIGTIVTAVVTAVVQEVFCRFVDWLGAETAPQSRHSRWYHAQNFDRGDNNKNFGGSNNNSNDNKNNRPPDIHHELPQTFKNSEEHMWRNAPGHISNTPLNRELLIATAANIANYAGTCANGNRWYHTFLENGQQVWASVRNGFIRNGGINLIPRTFDPVTGFCRNLKNIKNS